MNNYSNETPNLKVKINFFETKTNKVTIPSYHESSVDQKIIFYDICVDKHG